MEWYWTGLLCLGFLFLLLIIGMPIAFALGSIGLVGVLIIGGPSWLSIGPIVTERMLFNWSLIPVPLFIFLAELMDVFGITDDVFKAMKKWVGHFPAGLAVATTIACMFFAAITGSSVASAATMGRITLPSMIGNKYDKRLACGTVAAGGSLAMLIPPSIPMIIYGYAAGVSVSKLFMSGVIPGIIVGLLFCGYLVTRTKLSPQMAPPSSPSTWRERIASLKSMWAVFLLIISLLGGIYTGVATVTEAAALGVVMALIIGVAKKRLTLKGLKTAAISALMTTAFLFTIGVGAMMFCFFVTTLMIPQKLSAVLVGGGNVTTISFLLGMNIMWLILGCLMDTVSILLITVPIFLPTILALGLDPIWVGLIAIINVEAGMLTPPVGFNVYVIHGVAEEYGVTLTDVFRGITPFVFILLLVLVLVMIFPSLGMWLPNTMKG